MLTISDVAEKYHISHQQVHDLIEYGYLPVARIDRTDKKGIRYLFDEADVYKMDIHSYLAEIKDQQEKRPSVRRQSNFKQLISIVNRYDRFLDEIEFYPEKEVLEICFYLFHLNHYAKTYPEQSNALYKLKNSVLKKMYRENAGIMDAYYLQGPDRRKIWLCEDCKEAAHASGLSYAQYIQNEYDCPKCSLLSVEKEYYSLIEFRIKVDQFRFNFHLPLRRAAKWLDDPENLPHGLRKTGRCEDRMYLYGRPITRIEERIFTLPMIQEALQTYVDQDKPAESERWF